MLVDIVCISAANGLPADRWLLWKTKTLSAAWPRDSRLPFTLLRYRDATATAAPAITLPETRFNKRAGRSAWKNRRARIAASVYSVSTADNMTHIAMATWQNAGRVKRFRSIAAGSNAMMNTMTSDSRVSV
jgi:hypothetical protein